MRALYLGLALLFLAGCATKRQSLDVESPYVDPRTLRVGEILHLATGRLLAESEALDYLCRFPVVYVGEAHDNVEAHAVQLTVLKAMEACFPGQLALGLEMLQRPFQADADAFVRGEMSERDFERVWQKSWGDISYYRELLHFAREKRIPLLALNASAATRKAVREQPPSAMTPDAARQVPELDTQDPYHRAYVQAMVGGHAKGVSADAFYRVQLLWDETMAETAAEYLKSPAGRGRRLLVLAGSNHVRYGFGIPRRLFRRVPLPFVIVEPYVHGAGVAVPKDRLMDVDVPASPLRPADLYWAVRYRDLKGEQVKLGILVEDAGGAGVRVTGVLPGGPGHAAGLLAGDLIVSVDGTEVNAAADLIHEVGRHKRGEKGTIEVLRGGTRVPLAVTYDVLTHGK
ncbi:MAG TPA: ChaN family lipoprotein [Candidatus Deferrimicrobiaceae bacterium]|nr:ChaN family lipoprotein [Candidatus Deferrimicrobiaceae bacterium]